MTTTVYGVGMGEIWGKPYIFPVFHVDRLLPMQQNRMRITGCSIRINRLFSEALIRPKRARYVPIDSIRYPLYMGEQRLPLQPAGAP